MSEAIAARCGITYRQLDYWIRCNYIRPPDPTPGNGRTREWPPDELRIARDMGDLTRAGLIPHVAHKIARQHCTRAVLTVLEMTATEKAGVTP